MKSSERMIAELARAGFVGPKNIVTDEYSRMVGDAVMELIETFTTQGHSGFSATVTVDLFHRLVRGDVLTPLTADPSEWVEFASGQFQNKRSSSVFTEDRSFKTAYRTDGLVFVDKGGTSWSNRYSFVPFSIPGYPPKKVRRPEWLRWAYAIRRRWWVFRGLL